MECEYIYNHSQSKRCDNKRNSKCYGDLWQCVFKFWNYKSKKNGLYICRLDICSKWFNGCYQHEWCIGCEHFWLHKLKQTMDKRWWNNTLCKMDNKFLHCYSKCKWRNNFYNRWLVWNRCKCNKVSGLQFNLWHIAISNKNGLHIQRLV